MFKLKSVIKFVWDSRTLEKADALAYHCLYIKAHQPLPSTT